MQRYHERLGQDSNFTSPKFTYCKYFVVNVVFNLESMLITPAPSYDTAMLLNIFCRVKRKNGKTGLKNLLRTALKLKIYKK